MSCITSSHRISMLMFWRACFMMMIVSLQVHGLKSCIESERKGLLELKANFNSSQYPYEWPNDTNSDCCKWERVKCDLTSGRVIGLFLNHTYNPSPLLNLSLFYLFEDLQTLNLSFSMFADIHGYKSHGRLKKLEILDLSYNHMNNSILPFLNAASSLKTLILQGNSLGFKETFLMKELKNLEKLEKLDLSYNFIGQVTGLADFHNLQGLDLSNNMISGSLQQTGICQLKNLLEVDLSENKFIGPFPHCFSSLTQLQVLDISSNQLSGRFPSFISRFTSIEYLSFSDNEFEGLFSFELIANLSKLTVLKLSSRSSLLKVKTEISWQPKFQLSVIELPNCNLETVPSFLQHQKDLRVINLSNNKLTGQFPSWFLEKYPKLRILLLQNNLFTMFQLPRLLLNHSLPILDVSANSFDQRLPNYIGKVLPNLEHLNLSNNGFQGFFPSSLGEMKMIEFLDLSHNNLSGSLPKEFLIGCSSLRILKLSYNRFRGQIFPKPTKLWNLSVLIANNNLFTGIADGLVHSELLEVLDLSNNYLQGVIPSWLGEFDLMYLSVSGNLYGGTIPSTYFNMYDIKILDLSRNKFSGNLPTHFNDRPSYNDLLTINGPQSHLYLHDNEFNGTIPSSLIKDVLVLDLRNNKLSGTIPRFVNNQMISLLLRGNSLTGEIPTDLCGLRSLRLLDLANNRFNGSIPSCLNNVSFGRSLNYEIVRDLSGYYAFRDEELDVYSRFLVLPREFTRDYPGYNKFIVEFASKSRYDPYTERSLSFMSGLDFSSNELSGQIPKELGDLQKMRALNLSHNSLSGLIPESFSNLTDIESIDLSFNVLHGSIPQDISKLDYMVVFNVSYNNLSGSIPTQGKFSTLNESNFIANPLLSGSAISKSGDDNSTITFQEQGGDDETSIDKEIFYWSLAATYAVTWIAFIVFLFFDSPWRRAWFHLVDACINFFKCV